MRRSLIGIVLVLVATPSLWGARPPLAKGAAHKVPGWARVSKAQIEAARKLGIPVAKEINLGKGASMKFVLIPSGEFMMGSGVSAEALAKRFANTKVEQFRSEFPQHRVKITKPFYMAIHETTNTQYRAFKAGHKNGGSEGNSLNGNDQPAVHVSWNDSDAFCKWLTRKAGATCSLPTEAQWEYAGRAGSKSVFSWGEKMSVKHCNFADKNSPLSWSDKTANDGCSVAAPAAKYLPNVFGLHDMAGNVYEWCADWYREDYYRSSVSADPKGAATGKYRVLRGGSWRSVPRFCRPAYRHRFAPARANFNIGFRVVMSPSSRTGSGAGHDAVPNELAERTASTRMSIQYKGPLISDTSTPGEGKSEGIAPEISSCVQVSRDKWLILFGTVDPRGHDTNRSIFYQIRKGAPNGKVLKEGVIEKAKSNWDPLGVGHRFRKINAVVKVFGVPKGALRNGKPIPTANLFVAKWYTRPCVEINGRLVNLWQRNSPVKPATLGIYAYCLEWMQFRLNDAEDDIEIISPTRQLRQKGYNKKRDVISSLGPCRGMHHGFGDPVPNDRFSEWVEVCQFEYKMAAVKYSFNPTRGLYEWAKTGKAHGVPKRKLAEASLSKVNNSWIISIRSYNRGGRTAWYKTSDPFESFGARTDVKSPYCPRISFVCADGVLRLFANGKNPYGDRRNPLYCFDVDPVTFKYSNRQVVLDTRKENLPFQTPFIDHAMLYPHTGGRRQIISFRAINRTQTAGGHTKPDELAKSGIHYSELIYDKAYPNPWTF